MQNKLEIVYILLIVGCSMIFLGLILQFREARKEAFCNTLEMREFFEHKECRRYIK